MTIPELHEYMKPLRNIITMTIALLGVAVTAGTGGPLTLHGAIQLSLENNNRYKISQEKVNESKLRVREAWGRLWPDISTDATVVRFGADKGMESMTNGQYDIKFVKCSLAVNPGVFYNTLRASQDGRVIAENDQRKIREDTTIQTIKLYYRILLAGEIITLRTDSLKALEENLRVVTAGYRIGSFTRLDYLRASVAAANEKTRLINARNDYLSAKAALNIHLDREIDSPLELDRGAITAETEEENLIAKWTEEREKRALTEMIASALKNRPELIQIKKKKEAQIHGAHAVESLYLWPTLYANGSYGMNKIIPKNEVALAGNPVKHPDANYVLYDLGKILSPAGWNQNWAVTFGATYRWGGLVPVDPSHAKADQAKSQAKQTDLEMDDFVRSVRLDIQQGLLKLMSASNAILSQKGNIASAEESLRVAIVQFRNGMIDNTKLLDSNVELASAKSMYVQALYDFQTAKAELNRSVGYEYFSY
jgi:outer membrane protein